MPKTCFKCGKEITGTIINIPEFYSPGAFQELKMRQSPACKGCAIKLYPKIAEQKIIMEAKE